MEAFELGLLLLAAVLLSSIIDQLVPKVSSPLIQIGLGILIALLSVSPITIDIDPNLFIVLFIVPLIYDESKRTDKAALWKNRRPVLSLAIGLVIVAALVIGFLVNWIIPSIPLMAAFALGAALGPTDAVAVASLSKDINVPKTQKNVLEAESIINDASGIVSFQFAIAAAVTGAFSLVDASISFVISFFGGILIGIVLGYIANFAVRKIRSWGLENTTFHVLFEVFIPFIVYLVANAVGASGILAVVAAGLIGIISPRTMGPQASRLNIVSTSVWKVLSFTLNGLVFVLLGAQLPGQMERAWADETFTNPQLIGYILLITFALYLIRFIWLTGMSFTESRRRKSKQRLGGLTVRELLVMTFSGARGAITLALVMTIPIYIVYPDGFVGFPQRSPIIFMASGVIICTLLIATFIVPLLAPKKEAAAQTSDDEVETVLDILRNVIEELTDREGPESRQATEKVIRSYNDRINRLKATNDYDIESNKELRIKTLRWEQDRTLELIENNDVDTVMGYQYINRLAHIQNLIKHKRGYRWVVQNAFRHLRLIIRSVWQHMTNALPGDVSRESSEDLRKLQIDTAEFVVSKLQQEMSNPDAPTEDVTTIMLEYQRVLSALRSGRPTVAAFTKSTSETAEIERLGLKIELEQIQAMYDADRLSRPAAKRLRENVYLMQIDLEDHI